MRLTGRRLCYDGLQAGWAVLRLGQTTQQADRHVQLLVRPQSWLAKSVRHSQDSIIGWGHVTHAGCSAMSDRAPESSPGHSSSKHT